MRELLYRRYWARVAENRRVTRSRPGVDLSISIWGADPTRSFIDYMWRVPGTLPEKMLYQVLTNRGFNFYYAYYFGDLPFTSKYEQYRPDFLLPEYNIIIEIQGIYWHSRPGSYESDYQRALFLTAAGYKVYTITDQEIARDPYAALAQIPELSGPPTAIGRGHTGFRPADPTASLRAQRQKWPKTFTANFGRLGRVTKGLSIAYAAAGGRPPRIKEEMGLVYTWEMMDPDLESQYKAYGLEWKAYIDSLGEVFRRDSSAWAKYPTEWSYYNRWKNWWSRFGRT
jgi:very-short-patch-repair endonuclease